MSFPPPHAGGRRALGCSDVRRRTLWERGGCPGAPGEGCRSRRRLRGGRPRPSPDPPKADSGGSKPSGGSRGRTRSWGCRTSSTAPCRSSRGRRSHPPQSARALLLRGDPGTARRDGGDSYPYRFFITRPASIPTRPVRCSRVTPQGGPKLARSASPRHTAPLCGGAQ